MVVFAGVALGKYLLQELDLGLETSIKLSSELCVCLSPGFNV